MLGLIGRNARSECGGPKTRSESPCCTAVTSEQKIREHADIHSGHQTLVKTPPILPRGRDVPLAKNPSTGTAQQRLF